jgi:2-polyprenyl-6-methoxyphenol hydroxylase-like FAD-dependent oxidoreductase
VVMTDDVLIVGAGIAGLSLARALHQRGIPAGIVDRLPAAAEGRLGLNLPGNAVSAITALGLADRLAKLGVPVRRREYRDARGRLLFAVDEDAFWGEAARPRCVRRADLIELLGADLPAGTVRWSTEVTSIRENPDGVTVTLADATTRTCRLLVGADGVRSAVRKTIVGDGGVTSAVLSSASWRFTAPNPGVDGYAVWVGSDSTFFLLPVDAETVYGYASATRGGAVHADPDWLRTTFADYAPPVPEVVTALLRDPASLYHSPVEEVRIDRWSQGRVVLAGDAAHATAPVWAQGAAMAIEDALVLSGLLARQDDWSAIGPEYERRRRRRVAHVQAMTDRMSRAAGMPAWLRNVVLPFVGPRTYRATYSPLKTPAVD